MRIIRWGVGPGRQGTNRVLKRGAFDMTNIAHVTVSCYRVRQASAVKIIPNQSSVRYVRRTERTSGVVLIELRKTTETRWSTPTHHSKFSVCPLAIVESQLSFLSSQMSKVRVRVIRLHVDQSQSRRMRLQFQLPALMEV